MQVWLAHAVDKPRERDRSAEHGIAVDRFAREIGGILKASPGALAATECQTVGRLRYQGVEECQHTQ